MCGAMARYSTQRGAPPCNMPLHHSPAARTCVGVAVPGALAQRDAAAAAAGLLPGYQRLVVLRLGHAARCLAI